jgi:hypothetical protein
MNWLNAIEEKPAKINVINGVYSYSLFIEIPMNIYSITLTNLYIYKIVNYFHLRYIFEEFQVEKKFPLCFDCVSTLL